MVCVGQPMLIVENFNADPGIIPCLAKGIGAAQLVDLVLAHSVGSGVETDTSCKFKLDVGTGSRRDFVIACPNAVLASLRTSRFFLSSMCAGGRLWFLAPAPRSLSGLLAGWILQMGSA